LTSSGLITVPSEKDFDEDSSDGDKLYFKKKEKVVDENRKNKVTEMKKSFSKAEKHYSRVFLNESKDSTKPFWEKWYVVSSYKGKGKDDDDDDDDDDYSDEQDEDKEQERGKEQDDEEEEEDSTSDVEDDSEMEKLMQKNDSYKATFTMFGLGGFSRLLELKPSSSKPEPLKTTSPSAPLTQEPMPPIAGVSTKKERLRNELGVSKRTQEKKEKEKKMKGKEENLRELLFDVLSLMIESENMDSVLSAGDDYDDEELSVVIQHDTLLECAKKTVERKADLEKENKRLRDDVEKLQRELRAMTQEDLSTPSKGSRMAKHVSSLSVRKPKGSDKESAKETSRDRVIAAIQDHANALSSEVMRLSREKSESVLSASKRESEICLLQRQLQEKDEEIRRLTSERDSLKDKVELYRDSYNKAREKSLVVKSPHPDDSRTDVSWVEACQEVLSKKKQELRVSQRKMSESVRMTSSSRITPLEDGSFLYSSSRGPINPKTGSIKGYSSSRASQGTKRSSKKQIGFDYSSQDEDKPFMPESPLSSSSEIISFSPPDSNRAIPDVEEVGEKPEEKEESDDAFHEERIEDVERARLSQGQRRPSFSLTSYQ